MSNVYLLSSSTLKNSQIVAQLCCPCHSIYSSIASCGNINKDSVVAMTSCFPFFLVSADAPPPSELRCTLGWWIHKFTWPPWTL